MDSQNFMCLNAYLFYFFAFPEVNYFYLMPLSPFCCEDNGGRGGGIGTLTCLATVLIHLACNGLTVDCGVQQALHLCSHNWLCGVSGNCQGLHIAEQLGASISAWDNSGHGAWSLSFAVQAFWATPPVLQGLLIKLHGLLCLFVLYLWIWKRKKWDDLCSLISKVKFSSSPNHSS